MTTSVTEKITCLNNYFEQLDNETSKENYLSVYIKIELKIKEILLIDGIGNNMRTLQQVDFFIYRFSRLDKSLEEKYEFLNKKLIELYNAGL